MLALASVAEVVGRVVVEALPADATAGDYLLLDYFQNICRGRDLLRMVWLVDKATEQVLRASDLKVSSDGLTWVRV